MREFEAALAGLLSENQDAGGRRDYYGVAVDAMVPDGSEFDLTLTFKAGTRYCCSQYGCHLGYSEVAWWRHLREAMRGLGLAQPQSMTIRKLRVVVEVGSLVAILTDFGRGKRLSDLAQAYTYEVGPLAEADASY